MAIPEFPSIFLCENYQYSWTIYHSTFSVITKIILAQPIIILPVLITIIILDQSLVYICPTLTILDQAI